MGFIPNAVFKKFGDTRRAGDKDPSKSISVSETLLQRFPDCKIVFLGNFNFHN